MAHDILNTCPVCNERLHVKKLQCTHCYTEVTGDFQFSKLHYLSKDQLGFIEVFLKNRGNIKDCEKDLSISYPTVRRLLDEVIISLGYKANLEPEQSDRKDILAKLENGEITVQEATELLKK